MERNLKSIKQFVRENGITEQAVYKKMKQENNKKRLNGHITKLNGAKCLDEIAQEILSPCNQNKGNGINKNGYHARQSIWLFKKPKFKWDWCSYKKLNRISFDQFC